MTIRLEISPNQQIPGAYGLAYYDWERNKAICYPMPLNCIISLCFSLYFFFRMPPEPEALRIVNENKHLRQVNTLLRSERYALEKTVRQLKREIRRLEDECPDCGFDLCECEEDGGL